MNNDNLVRMVNRIGTFFAAMPDRDEALHDAAQHVRRFWEPRMRRQLLAHLDDHAGDGIDAFVLTALRRHRALFDSSPSTLPVRAEVSKPS
jgi:formate dehydrogenase subunit delta